MSAAKKPVGRGRPRVAARKTRQNVMLSPKTLKIAKKRAFQDGLSFSTWIDQLIREKLKETSA